MKTVRWMLCLVIAVLCTAAAPASGQQQQQQPILVGHIDHLEGELLRYVPETKDWVATVKDAPFGLEDALYSDKNTRAEIIMPNNTMLRIGGSTQVQLLRLTDDVTEIDIASGTARFYNNSSNSIIRATTPFGSVVAPAGTSFDLYVGDESVEVIGVKGRVEFVHPAGTTKYEVIAGSSSIVANRSQVSSGEGMTDASWNDWNTERDRIWEQRLAPRGETVRYLPEQLHSEAYALEEQGSWESVEYDGGQRQFWRPTRVSAGWAPYTFWQYSGDKEYLDGITDEHGRPVYVDFDVFKGTLEELYQLANATPPVSKTYTVKAGDTLENIAKDFNLRLAELVNANPQILTAGMKLTIPAPAGAGSTPGTGASVTYIVKAGDTLTAIALKFGTTVKAIADANHIPDPNLISVGQVLKVPK